MDQAQGGYEKSDMQQGGVAQGITYVVWFGWHISTDAAFQAILSLIGSAIGAALAAFVAWWVLRRQIDYDKKKEEIKEAKNFLKTYYLFSTSLEWLVRDLKKFRKELEAEVAGDVILVSSIDEDDVAKCRRTASDAVKSLDLIKDEYIPHEVYKDFHNIKLFTRIAELELELLSRGIPRDKVAFDYLDALENAVRNMREYARRLQEKVDKSS